MCNFFKEHITCLQIFFKFDPDNIKVSNYKVTVKRYTVLNLYFDPVSKGFGNRVNLNAPVTKLLSKPSLSSMNYSELMKD